MIRIGGGDGPRKVEPVVPIPRTGDKPRKEPEGSEKEKPEGGPEGQKPKRPKPKPGEPGYNVDIEV